MRSSAPLYDRLAPTYVEHFEVAHRRAYDQLAWDMCAEALPRAPAVVVDVGCGVGRWARRLLDAGYSVTGIEPARGMADEAARALVDASASMTLVRSRVEDVALPPASADAILAMGSLQYTEDPAAQIARLAGWLRPGGVLAVLVDGLLALALELVAAGKEEEAAERLATRRGVWRMDGVEADLHLLDVEALRGAYVGAGLEVERVAGLLVGASAFGRHGLTERLTNDYAGALAVERGLATQPDMADLGKQLLIVGRRPPRRGH